MNSPLDGFSELMSRHTRLAWADAMPLTKLSTGNHLLQRTWHFVLDGGIVNADEKCTGGAIGTADFPSLF